MIDHRARLRVRHRNGWSQAVSKTQINRGENINEEEPEDLDCPDPEDNPEHKLFEP